MRRKEREVTDIKEIEEILKKAEVLRIALNNGVYPYVVPVNYGFIMEGTHLTLFFHGAREGTKHEIIQKDNHVTFETDCGHALIRPTGEEDCTSSFAYESVIGHGVIEKAEESEKEELLALLLEHYGIAHKKFHPGALNNTLVYKIDVEDYTAKHRVNG